MTDDKVTLTREQAEALLDPKCFEDPDSCDDVYRVIREQLEPKSVEPTPGSWTQLNVDSGRNIVARLIAATGPICDVYCNPLIEEPEALVNAHLIGAAPHYHEWARQWLDTGHSVVLQSIFDSVYRDGE